MHETDPSTTRALLTRIAALLDVTPASFARREPAAASGPTGAECDELLMLFRQIEAPDRRRAVLRFLRTLAGAP